MRRYYRGLTAIRGLLLLLWLALLFLALLSLPVITRAAEPTYQITEQELSQLENNLNRLQVINQQSQADLVALRAQLETSQLELTAARQKSVQLEQQLADLKLASQKQSDLLATANKSLQTFAREEKRTRLRIKAQRTGWEAACVLLLVACAAK
jgi:septal ring factor EnvC (AmiA/AmiB activator)